MYSRKENGQNDRLFRLGFFLHFFSVQSTQLELALGSFWYFAWLCKVRQSYYWARYTYGTAFQRFGVFQTFENAIKNTSNFFQCAQKFINNPSCYCAPFPPVLSFQYSVHQQGPMMRFWRFFILFLSFVIGISNIFQNFILFLSKPRFSSPKFTITM